jgi:hypothetical protein
VATTKLGLGIKAMKRCPTCNKTFTDQNLSFCTDDGTPLITLTPEDQRAKITSSNRSKDSAAPSYDASDWKAPSYQPPGSYLPPGQGNKRRVWPWVLGTIGVLVIGIAGISIAVLLLLPRMMRTSTNRGVSSNNANAETNNRNERADSNSSQRNENLSDTGKNTNTVEGSTTDNPPPADRDQVLAQLTDLEHDWTVANLNADKKKLDRILADDYVGTSSEGKTQGKAEYIRTIERDTSVQKWDFENLKLSLRGDRATLTGTVRLVIENKDVAYNFTDKFVWRDGRWQATGSEVTLAQSS